MYIYVYIKNKNQEYKRIDISYFLTISHLDLSPFRSQITSIKEKSMSSKIPRKTPRNGELKSNDKKKRSSEEIKNYVEENGKKTAKKKKRRRRKQLGMLTGKKTKTQLDNSSVKNIH